MVGMQSKKIGLLLALALMASALDPAFAFIKTKSGMFINAQGKEVFFKGLGLGGWLVPEGYMLHMPGFGSPSSINAQIEDVIGASNADQFWKKYRANYVTRADIQLIASWGFNLIRLPFNYRLLSPEGQPGVYLEEGFAVIDSLIEWCRAHRLYVVLDMHCAPGGQNADNISDSDGFEARLWTETANQDRTVEIWQKIAQRYANDTTVVGYDLLNEPVLPQGYPATELRSLYMRITSAIRQVDPNHIVFIEGNWYGTDFTSLTPPWDANLSYSFHKYWNETSVATIQSYLNIRKTYGTPLWMGESGENSNHWFASVVQMLEENKVSWCWWTHKKFETITSPFSARLTSGFQSLVDYWNGQGAKPDQTFAFGVLMQTAENLKFEQCDFRPDVLQALFNPDFLTRSSPFKKHEIPGTINCVDFDYGGNGVAYHDTDYQRTRWDVYTPWNTGEQYRNDGVDIEESRDDGGAKYSVGWIESGEWLNYTIQVKSNGLYDVILRVASPQSSGKVQLLMDDLALTDPISINKTGGWYNWDTITIKNLALQSGQRLLTLKFLNGGFNINQMEFIKTTDIEGEDRVPFKFELGQNYPNPFNGATRIPFYVGQKSTVRLDIFDLRGRLVFSDVMEGNGAGSFFWSARDLENRSVGSGIYLYRVQVGQNEKQKKMVLLK
ncbi:glycoside hydrolase family 5 [Caldithrix abyssi DSM 13497]|uniref:Glycoside hydrolase family 5 n=2 Tax=Caldithrix abyssi DSM 13497 TaxID=880073 RepID=H1XXI7_CALAY|nr:cellulase family glycosylhydrolase [Caldithrix abyssi]EHO43111.1 glycoside hydrolase family 5 [Caldithrix abyssi DSM 13497]